MSINQVMQEQNTLLSPSLYACIFTVYYWEWDSLSKELPHIKVWSSKNCVREANIQAGICVREQLHRYDKVHRACLPEPNIDRNGKYVDLDYNVTCMNTERKISRNGKNIVLG